MPAANPARSQIEQDLILRKLLRISNDGILIFGDRGRKVLDANPQAMRLLGYSRGDLPSLTVDGLFADPGPVAAFFESLWAQPVRSAKRGLLEQVTCRHKSGRVVGASLSASMIVHSGQAAALAVIGERLRRRRTNDFLRNQAKLSGLLHSGAGTTITTQSLQRDVRDWLRRVCHHAQLPVGHVHILPYDLTSSETKVDVWHIKRAHQFQSVREHPDCLCFPEDCRSRVAASRIPEVVADIERAPHFATPEFRELNLRSAIAIPVTVDERVGAISEFFSNRPLEQDPLLVDALECLGRELGFVLQHHAVSVRAMREQDEERRRLARELHDTTAQGLAMMLLDLGTIDKESEALSPNARTAVSQSIELARKCLGEIRTLSYLLHPPMLDELGLLSALQIFTEGFSRRSGIRVDVGLPRSLPRMPADWEMAVFRVVQEGLTNVQRHSSSRTAMVRLNINGHTAHVLVENEGASVPPLSMGGLAPEHAGVGIAGMRERVQALGGSVLLYSQEDQTVLEVTVPVPKTVHLLSEVSQN